MEYARQGYTFRAAVYDKRRGVRELDEAQTLRELKRPTGLLWVHLEVQETHRAAELLGKHFGFHPLEVEDALSTKERPSLHLRDKSLFLVVPIILCNKEADTYVEVGMFLGENYLVTVGTEQVPLIDRWFEAWKSKPQEMSDSSADLLHSVLDAVVDDYFPATDVLEQELDEMEDRVFQLRGFQLADALSLKRRLLEMRRRLSPIRDILNGLLRRDVTIIPTSVRPYFVDVYEHTIRLAETIDLHRDVLSSVMDAHLSLVSNNLNNVMRKMTVISTLLMTAALVAGVYGMNFDVMPELHWAWGYPFAIFLMVLLGALEIWLFRWKKWL